MSSLGRGSGEFWCLRVSSASPSSRVMEDAHEVKVSDSKLPQNCICGPQWVKAGEDKRVPVASHLLDIWPVPT